VGNRPPAGIARRLADQAADNGLPVVKVLIPVDPLVDNRLRVALADQAADNESPAVKVLIPVDRAADNEPLVVAVLIPVDRAADRAFVAVREQDEDNGLPVEGVRISVGPLAHSRLRAVRGQMPVDLIADNRLRVALAGRAGVALAGRVVDNKLRVVREQTPADRADSRVEDMIEPGNTHQACDQGLVKVEAQIDMPLDEHSEV
jgi:hypothetical protein